MPIGGFGGGEQLAGRCRRRRRRQATATITTTALSVGEFSATRVIASSGVTIQQQARATIASRESEYDPGIAHSGTQSVRTMVRLSAWGPYTTSLFHRWGSERSRASLSLCSFLPSIALFLRRVLLTLRDRRSDAAVRSLHLGTIRRGEPSHIALLCQSPRDRCS